MPEMPTEYTQEKQQYAEFLKPKEVGETKTLVVKAPHRIGPNGPILDVAVKGGNKLQTFSFGLNKTNTKVLVKQFGSTNTDVWVKGEFKVHAVKHKNPKTGEMVPSWEVI